MRANRAMPGVFNSDSANLGVPLAALLGSAWSNEPARAFPDLNAWETQDNVVVTVDLPGFKAPNVELIFADKVLTLRGRRERRVPEGATPLTPERGSNEFERSIRVNVPVDGERVTAQFRDGVLTVTLPKAAAARARRIDVQASDN
jgi:HSP20 family protein